ncbi:MAG: hypothetical protein JWL77_1020 [Chthonomonadaceae bacterium]|nr:hypothetical protein [Chthonomonadaceae bacterium]
MTDEESLNWFKCHLDRQIVEMELETQGFFVELFFDTSDVRKAILGMEAFTPDHFQIEQFRHRRTLVSCLAASGWLGQFGMLPPHQAEILRHIEYFEKTRPITVNNNGFAERFLEAVSQRSVNQTVIDTLQSQDINDMISALLENMDSTETFFKAIQCIQGGNWEERLNTMVEGNFFCADPMLVDYPTLIKSPEFMKIYSVLEEKRQGGPEGKRNRSQNNFADAVALALLSIKAQSFTRRLSPLIPCYYDSTGLFAAALRDAKLNVICTSPDGRELEVLQDDTYFLFRSTFRPPREISSDGVAKHNGPPTRYGTLEQLQELQRDIESLRQTPGALTQERIKEITLNQVPLTELIQELQQASFLEKVWLPFAAAEQVKMSVQNLKGTLWRGAVSTSENPNAQKQVKAKTKEFRQLLSANAEEHLRVAQLWNGLDNGLKDFAAIVSNNVAYTQDIAPETMNIFLLRDVGLLPFPLPMSGQRAMPELLQELLFETDTDLKEDARSQVIERYYRVVKSIALLKKDRQSVDIQAWNDSLVSVACILWLAHIDDLLLKILETSAEASSAYSPDCVPLLDILSLLAYQRKEKVIPNEEAIFASLKARCTDRAFFDPGSVALGLAYVYYRLYRPDENNTKAFQIPRGNSGWADLAVEYARIAYEWFLTTSAQDELFANKRVYALNNYLFYMCRAENEKYRDTMKTVSIKLWEQPINLWHFRYDDTLANYYLRLAQFGEDRDYNLGQASARVEAALEKAPNHPQIHETSHSILREKQIAA